MPMLGNPMVSRATLRRDIAESVDLGKRVLARIRTPTFNTA